MQSHPCRSGLSPEFIKLAKAGHLEAWNLPLGASEPLPRVRSAAVCQNPGRLRLNCQSEP